MIVILGSLSSCVMYQPRLEYAMAKDNLFFKCFGHAHPKYNTPDVSIILQGALGIFFIFVSDLTSLLGYFTLVMCFKNTLTFAPSSGVVNATITNRCGVLRLSG
ncbi:putative fructoselysine transporter [Shigella flexneri]|nr:putative fructoselysine transporter [Shigella flexneri]